MENGIAVLTMRYPKNLNAIDEQMAEELLCRFQDAERDDAVKVVVLQSDGKAFSAGGDIGSFISRYRPAGRSAWTRWLPASISWRIP